MGAWDAGALTTKMQQIKSVISSKSQAKGLSNKFFNPNSKEMRKTQIPIEQRSNCGLQDCSCTSRAPIGGLMCQAKNDKNTPSLVVVND
jgi:hypothetical protein